MRDVLIHAALLLKLVHTLNYLSPIASKTHAHSKTEFFYHHIYLINDITQSYDLCIL